MTHTVYLVSAFCIDGAGGNIAGVVFDADTLTDVQKQTIATMAGHSETAFVESSNVAEFKVRFFTPVGEVDLCGHATIATYALLFAQKRIRPGTYTQELKAGVLSVEIKENGQVWMEQSLPVFGVILTVETLQPCINHELRTDGLEPQIVSTGLQDILVPMNDHNQLDSLIFYTNRLLI